MKIILVSNVSTVLISHYCTRILKKSRNLLTGSQTFTVFKDKKVPDSKFFCIRPMGNLKKDSDILLIS